LQVYEYVTDDEKCVRVEDLTRVKGFVKDNQQYAMVEQHLAK
jgi:hypothetical protein